VIGERLPSILALSPFGVFCDQTTNRQVVVENAISLRLSDIDLCTDAW
jgi:hypothetical protein